MSSLQELIERRLGLPGVIGLALLVVVVAFYFGGLLPAEAERGELRSELAHRARKATTAPAAREPQDLLGEFYGHFGPPAEALAALRTIFDAAAAEGVAVDLGEYRVTREPASRLLRYQIVLPLKARYPAVRRFVARALNDVPGLALDDLSLRRESAAASSLEARVRLSLYLERE
jgi:hypothetical protein